MPISPTGSSASRAWTPAPISLDEKLVQGVVTSPGAKLMFASFDPDTASKHRLQAFENLSLNDKACPPRRIVIEVKPDGAHSWRFVPFAECEPGSEESRLWPRMVHVLGAFRELTQDEWDLYKIHPNYACRVRSMGNISEVIKVANIIPELESEPPVSEPITPQPGSKRRHSPSPILEPSQADETPRRPRQRARSAFGSTDSDESEFEVDGLIDGKVYSEKLKKVRRNKRDASRRNRQRVDKHKLETREDADSEDSAAEDVQHPSANLDVDEDIHMMSMSEVSNTSSPVPVRKPEVLLRRASTPWGKRKYEHDDSDEESNKGTDHTIKSRTTGGAKSNQTTKTTRRCRSYEKSGEAKRNRTTSPTTLEREYRQKRTVRGEKRREEKRKREELRKKAKEEAMLKNLYEEAQRSGNSSRANSSGSGSDSQPNPYDIRDEEMQDDFVTPPSGSGVPSSPGETEEEYRARLEASRRKMEEFNRHQREWDEKARSRKKAEEEREQREKFERRSQKAAEEAQKSRADKEAKQAQEHAKMEKQKEEELARRRDKRTALRALAAERARGYQGVFWNVHKALSVYSSTCEDFDSLSFRNGDVIIFETVPWPVLHKPGTYGVEHIDWESVEAFFIECRKILSHADYLELLDKSRKRFHPDRWKARKVFDNVDDKEERTCMELAATTVAQALAPLLDEAKGQ